MKGFWVVRQPLFLLVVVSGVWLLICFLASETALFPDSVEYLNSGREFARSGSLGELYRRPPVYPLLVGTCLHVLTEGGLRPAGVPIHRSTHRAAAAPCRAVRRRRRRGA